ncbi:MAG: LuxR C-terminal-related transcriptional regulator [Tannerella sp.]|nr:LuxR C-terminal-related transcriptional regulator [Tannerella sp.]
MQQLGLIKLVASTPTNHNQELLKQVSLINNSDVPVEDMLVWTDLYKLIDSIYDGFYVKMTSKYGAILTEKEKQLCCLLCAGFSTKEISVISQQSVQTIYQRKTTIRQKLKMDEKEDIIDFIKS